MWKPATLVLLLWVTHALDYLLTPYQSFILTSTSTLLDYYIDSSGNFFGLVANSTGFQINANYANYSQATITTQYNAFVDLTTLTNPYNPYIAGLLFSRYIVIVYKTQTNTSQLGGVRIHLDITNNAAVSYT